LHNAVTEIFSVPGGTLGYIWPPMDSPELQRLRAAIQRDPANAELRYLLGAELA